MKKSNISYTLRCIFDFKGPKIANLDDIANLEILPYGLHFSEIISFTKIIKDADG